MITAFIKGQAIETAESVIVAESLNYLKAQFVFVTNDWNGLEKTAYFTQGKASHPAKLDENNITIDYLHLGEGEWAVSVVGREYANGELIERITTDSATINVRPFKAGAETPFPEPAPTEIERVEGKIGNLSDLATKDKTSLVNAINELYRKGGSDEGGGNGIDGFSPIVNITEIDGGHRVTITDAEGKKTFDVLDGEDGKSGVYVGSGDMPEGYNVQIDPEGEVITIPLITQEAGESESLVMSQKAVTDLVSDAISKNETFDYETVDSVDKMTDTSKQYVLSSTGTLWVYGESGSQPAFTNLADPTSGDWGNEKRLNSSNVLIDYSGFVTTNFIPVSQDDVIRMEGIDTVTDNFGRLVIYSPSKTIMSHAKVSASTSYCKDIIADTTNVQFAMSVSTVGYIRFTGAGTADKVIITKNEEIVYKSGYDWYDTKMTPETAAGGGNYVKLLVKVNKNKSDIEEINKRVIAIETGNETVTIPSFWQSAVDECIAKIKALQVGRNCVTFPFFSDNHQRNGYAGMLISHIMKECGILYCFFGGDTISSGIIADEAEMISQDEAFDAIMSYIPEGRFCRAVGNHDGYWYDGTSKHSYTRDQIFELFLREESLAQNKHYGEDGTYYYIDDIVSKVRFIILNTNSKTISAGKESIDSAQLSWLQNSALMLGESGWGVVIISHCPISNHYHANVTNAEEVISVINNSDVDIIGWYSGHIHRDRIYTYLTKNGTDGVEGDNYSELGFTEVTITSDHTSIAYDDATKHTVAEDNQSHAIDFVTINKSTRTVNITRLGIGNDRSYTY